MSWRLWVYNFPLPVCRTKCSHNGRVLCIDLVRDMNTIWDRAAKGTDHVDSPSASFVIPVTTSEIVLVFALCSGGVGTDLNILTLGVWSSSTKVIIGSLAPLLVVVAMGSSTVVRESGTTVTPSLSNSLERFLQRPP